MAKVVIKYRNGFPTKKSMRELIDSYDEKMWALFMQNDWGKYKKPYYNLIWSRDSVQERIEGFIDYASSNGIVFGKYDPYNSPSVGHLQVLRFEPNKT